MTIKGKKRYGLYLDEDNVEIVNRYLDSRHGSGGLSGLVDQYLANIALTLEKAELGKGEKMTLGKLIKLGLHGFRATKNLN